MTVVGSVSIQIAGWKTITFQPAEPHPSLIVEGSTVRARSTLQVLVDGELIVGCTDYKIDAPERGILTATLTLSPGAGSTTESLLACLARWGIKPKPEPA